MTAAQKKARSVFIKAIAYRKKHPGVTLKQAFAWAKKNSGSSVSSLGYKKMSAVKKKVAKKKAPPKSYHKDTKSHNVNVKVVSGVPKWTPKNYAKKVKDVGNLEQGIKLWTINLANAQAELYVAKTKAEKRELRKEIQVAKRIITQLKRLK